MLVLKKYNDKKELLKITKIIISVLLLAQPIFDIIKTRVIHDIQIFGFSFFEIFNIAVIFILGFLAIVLSENKKKLHKYIIFGILFVIYFGLHCYNMTLFNNNVYPKHTTNFLVEFYYIYKTFINPLILMISLYYIGIDKKYLIKLIKYFSLIISVVIIIGDVFHFGYKAYGESASYCTKSIFDWFNFKNTYKYSFYELTCRGLYFSANQLSATTFMIMPIILYSAYKNRKKIDYFALVCLIISMYMLGTKVSTLGVLAVFGMFYFLYFFFLIYNKNKKNNIKLNNVWIITIIMLLSVILFFYSPRSYEMKFKKEDISSVQLIEDSLDSDETGIIDFKTKWDKIKKSECYNMTKEEKNFFLEFFDKYSDKMGVSSFIINSYNPKKNPEFWCDYLKNAPNNDYRVLKTSILNKIYADNNNKLDKYLGLGYNLNFIYTETDYSFQYYSYGIIGCILFFGGYFITILYSLYKIIKDKKFKFENILLLSCPAIALFTAQFSGHVLERTIPLLTMAFLSGIILVNTKNEKEQ